MFFSNSKYVRFKPDKNMLPTHDGLLAKKDVDNSDVFVPGDVEFLLGGLLHQILLN